MKEEKDVFIIARERGEELLREMKKVSILQDITKSDIAAAEERLQAAAKANDEEAFIKAKAEIESLKNRAEMAKMREKMGIDLIIPSDLIREVFTPVVRETSKEHKRIVLELADALEKVMDIATEGMNNLYRYNGLVNFWKSHVMRSGHFSYGIRDDFGFFIDYSAEKLKAKIQQMRKTGNE